MNARVRRGGPLARTMVATAIGVGIGAGLLVWTRTEILSLRYDLARAVHAAANLRKDVEKLRVERAALSTPERIEPAARKLGLRYPQPGQVIRLDGPDVAAEGPR